MQIFGSKPKVIVVTNLFRDQLDRYGEVTHTLENIRTGIRDVPEAVLCLNADCSLTSSLALDLPNPCVWFGIEKGPSPPGQRRNFRRHPTASLQVRLRVRLRELRPPGRLPLPPLRLPAA